MRKLTQLLAVVLALQVAIAPVAPELAQAALSSTTARNDYTGNGSVSSYSYTFKIFSQSELEVTVRDTDDVETALTLTTHYTVTGAGSSAGGTIALVAGFDWMTAGGKLKSGYALTIRRVRALTQTASIRNQTAFHASVHEDVFDKLVMNDQQQQDEINRTIKLPSTVTSSSFAPTLPSDIAGAVSKAPVTNADGDGWADAADWPSAADISTASASATAAAASATAAAASQTAASASEDAAADSETAAAASEAAAAASETNAAASETAAAASEDAAADSETAAAASETAAAASASAASTSATNASNSASAASTSATNASNSASAASTSATNASNSASAAATSETNAAASAASAASAVSTHEADTTNVHGITDTSALATKAGTENLTNKTMSDPLTFDEVASPSAPAASKRKLYPKSNGKFYHMGSDGVEKAMGSATGFASDIGTNTGFEEGTNGWSASGGTTTTTTTTAAHLGSGTRSYEWDSSAATQTLTNTAVTITANDGLSSQNGAASCRFKTASGTATHTIQAYDGTNVLNSATITSSTSGYVRTTVNFPFPASGNVSLRVVSVNANEPTIYIDDCYLGLAEGFNLLQASQAVFYGSLTSAATASCEWSSAATSGSAFAADTDCSAPSVTGSVTAAATKVPGFVVQGPGKFRVDVQGARFITTSTGDGTFSWYLSDGTIHSNGAFATIIQATDFSSVTPVTGSFTFEVTDSNSHTFSIYTDTTGGTLRLTNNYTTADRAGLNFQVYRFPTSTEQAFRPDQAPRSGHLKYAQAASCRWTTTSASFAAFSADTDCSAPTATGSLSATATKIPGAVAGAQPAGLYMVVASGWFEDDNSADVCEFTISDGTNASGNVYTSSTSRGHHVIVGYFNYTANQSGLTYQIQGKRTSGSTSTCNIRNDQLGNNNFEISLIPIGFNVATPLTVNSVTSNSSGLERVERANIANAGTCSISAQSGSWLSGISGPASAGACALTFAAGTFSAAPTCVATAVTDAHYSTMVSTAATTSGVTIRVRDASGQNVPFNLICMGPR